MSDTPDDYDPLVVAGKKLVEAEIITPTNSVARCYVLVGFPKDTFDAAEMRVVEALTAGFSVYIMPYRGDDGVIREGWDMFYDKWQASTKIKIALSNSYRSHLFEGKQRRKPGRPKGGSIYASVEQTERREYHGG